MSRVGDVCAHIREIDVEGAVARRAAVTDFAHGQTQDPVFGCGNGRDEGFWFLRQHAEAAMDVDDAGAAAGIGEFEDRVAVVLRTHGRDDVAGTVGESVDTPVAGDGGEGEGGVDAGMGTVKIAQPKMNDARGVAGRCAE